MNHYVGLDVSMKETFVCVSSSREINFLVNSNHTTYFFLTQVNTFPRHLGLSA